MAKNKQMKCRIVSGNQWEQNEANNNSKFDWKMIYNSPITFEQLFNDMIHNTKEEYKSTIGSIRKEITNLVTKSNKQKTTKSMMKANDKLRLGSCLLADVKRNFDSNKVHLAIANITEGICALPPIPKGPHNGSKGSASSPNNSQDPTSTRAELEAIKLKYRDAYYARALAFYLVDRHQDFEHDAMLALQVCDNTQQFYLIRALVNDLTQTARQLCSKMNRLIDSKMGSTPNAQIRIDGIRKKINRIVNRTFEWIERYACLNKDNRGKVTNLIEMYLAIRNLMSSDEQQEPMEPKSPIVKNSNNQVKHMPMKTTNALEKVTIDPIEGAIKSKGAINKNKVIFFERMVAFVPKSDVQFCANCYKKISLASFPCPNCIVVIFCGPACESQANHETGKHKLVCKIDEQIYKRLGLTAYITLQIIAYCASELNHIIQVSVENFPTETIKKLLDGHGNVTWKQVSLAFLLLRQHRYHNWNALMLESSPNGQKIRSMIREGIFLYELIQNKLELHGGDKEKLQLFKLIMHLMFFVEHYPLAWYNLGHMNASTTDKKFVKCGIGFGPIGALLKFQCDNNVMRRHNDRRGIVEYVACRDIQPNEVLTIGWGLPKNLKINSGEPQADSVSKREQISSLLDKQYLLKCDCSSCAGGQSTYAPPQLDK